MTRRLHAVALAGLLALAPAALAGTETHEGANIQLWHPDDWKAAPSEGRIVVTDAAGEVWLGAWIVEGADLASARAALAKSVAAEAPDLKVAHEGKLKHHGLAAVGFEGTATRAGKTVRALGHLVEAAKKGEKKVLLVLVLAPEARDKACEKTVAKIFDSIAPAK